MRDGIVLESVVVGLTTLGIGSALMFVPIETKWWPFAGTFSRLSCTLRLRILRLKRMVL